MTWRGAYYVLAVIVLMGGMAVAALADDQGMSGYEPADSSVSSRPEQDVDQPDAGEIREPTETGAVPEWSLDSSDRNANATGDEPTVEYGGKSFRLGIDTGP